MNENLTTFIDTSEEVLIDAYVKFKNAKLDPEQYHDLTKSIRELADVHLKAIEIGIKERLEDKKIEMEAYKAKRELNNQIAQVESEIKNQMLQLVIGTGLQIVGIMNYDLVYFSGLNFEKTGTPCSKFFSTVIQRSSDLLKTKK